MKLLISNQHGAIVMAVLPFLYGMSRSDIIWQHFFLFFAWFCLYLMSYPLLQWIKGKDRKIYQKWTALYALASLIFALPAFWYNPTILLFSLALIPFAGVSVYYAKQKNERALINDLNAIIIFAIGGMMAYFLPHSQWNAQLWQVAFIPSLYLIGVTLYVKSVLRERKNPHYLLASYLFHGYCVVFFLAQQQMPIALAFMPALIRAILIPCYKLNPKQVGIIEVFIACVFFCAIL